MRVCESICLTDCCFELNIMFGTSSMFSVHFLYSRLLLFFCVREPLSSVYSLFLLLFGIRESPTSICLANHSTALKESENEPKEKSLFQQVFFEEILCSIYSKSIFEFHPFLLLLFFIDKKSNKKI